MFLRSQSVPVDYRSPKSVERDAAFVFTLFTPNKEKKRVRNELMPPSFEISIKREEGVISELLKYITQEIQQYIRVQSQTKHKVTKNRYGEPFHQSNASDYLVLPAISSSIQDAFAYIQNHLNEITPDKYDDISSCKETIAQIVNGGFDSVCSFFETDAFRALGQNLSQAIDFKASLDTRP